MRLKYYKKVTVTISMVLVGSIFLIGCKNDNNEDQLANINKYNVKATEEIKTFIKSESEVVDENSFKENFSKVMSILDAEKNNITKLVNKENPLEYNYKPKDLVKPNFEDTKGDIFVREVCVDALENMLYSAKEEGINLYLVSGFRSSEFQERIYNNSLKYRGQDHNDKYIARPGYSEHQTGLAVDISAESVNRELNEEFKNTKEGIWLKENAHKFGFILRYTSDREGDTGYAFEPWHFRYLGKEISTYIYENNLILEDLYNK